MWAKKIISRTDISILAFAGVLLAAYEVLDPNIQKVDDDQPVSTIFKAQLPDGSWEAEVIAASTFTNSSIKSGHVNSIKVVSNDVNFESVKFKVLQIDNTSINYKGKIRVEYIVSLMYEYVNEPDTILDIELSFYDNYGKQIESVNGSFAKANFAVQKNR